MTLRQDYESSASKLKSLERQVKTLRQEKDEVHKVFLLGPVVDVSSAVVLLVSLFSCVLMFSSSRAAAGRLPGAFEESDQGAEGGPLSEETGPAGVLGPVGEDVRPALLQAASVPSAAGQRGGDGRPPAEDGHHETGDPQDGEEPQGGESAPRYQMFLHRCWRRLLRWSSRPKLLLNMKHVLQNVSPGVTRTFHPAQVMNR